MTLVLLVILDWRIYMTHFLKNHAKLFYIIFGIFGFFFVVASCFYITPYNNTFVNFNAKVVSGEMVSMKSGNEYLVLFCMPDRTGGAFNFDDMYQALYQFNNQLQTANYMILALGVVALVGLAGMLICSNASRKRYYISNLVSGIVFPAATIITAILALVYDILPIAKLTGDSYTKINWGALGNTLYYDDYAAQYANGDTSSFAINSTPLIIFAVIIVLFIVATGLLIAYNVYRYMLTRKEINTSKKEVEQDA